MKRPNFLRVVNAPEPRAGTTIAGVRNEGDLIKVGTVVPAEWFGDVPDEVFAWLINPPEAEGIGVIVEHTPDTKEMMFLKSQYPSLYPPAAPKKSKKKVGGE